ACGGGPGVLGQRDGGRGGDRRDRRRPAGAARRHPHRLGRDRRHDGPQTARAADPARRAVRRRGRRPAARGQPVHPVRRRPQGPPAELVGRRPRPRRRAAGGRGGGGAARARGRGRHRRLRGGHAGRVGQRRAVHGPARGL
ncbi:MAG: D-aminoacyl-tRNA deacylase, partial [uncultured Corynebacteriales bacterium]